MSKSILVAILIVVATFAVSLYFYPALPERVASHWDSSGAVNGYMGKFWGTFLFPMILLLCVALFVGIPALDPLKKNIEEFRKYYDGFVVFFTAFMAYVNMLVLAWNLGHRFNMTQFLVPAFAILFFYIGVLVGHAKRNWFVGIRTPWTMSSDSVWEKTHSLGGRLFKVCALFCLLGLFMPRYTLLLVLAPVLASSIYLLFYSYVEYQKEIKLKN